MIAKVIHSLTTTVYKITIGTKIRIAGALVALGVDAAGLADFAAVLKG